MLRSTLTMLLFCAALLRANVQDMPPFYGEWWPDSVKAQGKEVRQFLFIPKSGKFFRCSYETERYVLDSALTIRNGRIENENGTTWQLSQPDATHLILTGPDYYGRFKLDMAPHIISLEDGLREFLVGDTVKQFVLGSWELQDLVVDKLDTVYYSEKEILEIAQLRSMLWVPYHDEFEIEFLPNNQVIVYSGNQVRRRKFTVDDEWFSFTHYDFLSTPDYQFQDGTLRLTYKDIDFQWTYVFRRKD